MVNQTSPRDRLLQLARQRGVSLSGLSEMLGRNASYLQQFIRKGSPRRLEESDRRTLAQFFAVPESELGGADPEGAARRATGQAPRLREEWIEVPRLAIGAAAGAGAMASDEAPFDSFRFSPRWLRDAGLSIDQLSTIRVTGDSMVPLLNDGDEILVDKGQRSLRDGIHVVRLDDVLLVKRLAPAGRGRASLISENHAYPPVEVSLDELEIVGRVVWKGGRL
ncbi:S24 family peptidase [Altererythrobacter sp. TH136]|uniref:S24 family peptidase n=1 Tax=Altererythrobacter sp. TH136 TaxID=2067415 RepID=UPI0011631373|nr:S24 family peptidase [Altererythrobacter sp. TH136]QDM40248.1 S24 family peptidase [Altererythrobacter sp. TH136]